MRKILGCFLALVLATSSATAQSIPNGGIDNLQVWTLAQWQNAWQTKWDYQQGLPNNIPFFTSGGSASAPMSGDCTNSAMLITCTKSGGVSFGSMAFQNANAVAIVGGAIDATAIGGTTKAAGGFTTLTNSGTFTLGAGMTATGQTVTGGTFSGPTITGGSAALTAGLGYIPVSGGAVVQIGLASNGNNSSVISLEAGTGSGFGPGLVFKQNTTNTMRFGSTGWVLSSGTAQDIALQAASGLGIGFYVNGNTTADVAIHSNGNVTFNTGSLFFGGYVSGSLSNGQAISEGNATNGATFSGKGSTYDVSLLNAAGSVAFGVPTGTQNLRLPGYGAGALTTDSSGNVTATSDPRLKDDQGAYTAGLDEIMQLVPHWYKWKPETGYDTENQYAGFLATDDFPIPGAVFKAEGKPNSLWDRAITAALVNSVHTLKAANDNLTTAFNAYVAAHP